MKITAFLSNNLPLIVCCTQLVICVIFTSKLEIAKDGNDVLDGVLDVKQLWYKMYALSVFQIIYISWNRNIKRKIIICSYTKLRFYVQI